MGVTTLSLALCNYINNKLHKQTAYIECNTSNEISELRRDPQHVAPISARMDTTPYSTIAFRYYDISIYPNITISALPDMLHLPYKYILVDLGVINPHTRAAFLGCQQRILIGSLRPWKIRQFQQCYHMIHENIISELCLCLLSLEKNFANRKSTAFHGKKITPLLFLDNPFFLTPEDWNFLKKILQGI